MSVAAASSALPFAIEFGRPLTAEIPPERGVGLQLNLPVLGGQTREVIFSTPGTPAEKPGLRLWASGDLLIGWAAETVKNERNLKAQTQALYERVLAAAQGRHLYRIWNYVPHINAETDGLENYRAFCQGRSLAFEKSLGESFPRLLSAASAVGAHDDFLTLIFVAGSTAPRHVENPEQIPAYRYPAEHGPRAPSFSRATVAHAGGRVFTFISGTSAIKGHATVAPDALPEQLDCTLDNLRLISREAGTGESLGAGSVRERHFKIYLRRPADFPSVRARLERDLLRPGDSVTYLRSDICRAALHIEIEATLIG